MQGLVLAAGQGLRLRPLTCMIAKPALRVMEKPLIWYAIRSVIQSGVDSLLVTLYHKADSVLTLGLDADFDIPIGFLVEPELLNTGGGVKNAARFITDEQLLICNGDTLWDFNLESAIAEHIESKCDLTLILTTTPEWQDYAAIRTDEHGEIVRIGTLTEIPNRTGYLSPPYTFTGIYLLKTSLLAHLPDVRVFDLVSDFVAPLMMEGLRVRGIVVAGFWEDMGTFERYLHGGLHFAERLKGVPAEYLTGQNCNIGEGSKLVNSILWDHVTIAPSTRLRNCIAVDWVNLEMAVQLENVLLFPKTITSPDPAEFGMVSVSNTWAFPLNLSD